MDGLLVGRPGRAGHPANTEILASIQSKLSATQQTVAKFISDIKPEPSAAQVAPNVQV